MKELEKSLENLVIIVRKYKILKTDNSPLTGEEFSQLFLDLKNLSSMIQELDRLQKVIASDEQPVE